MKKNHNHGNHNKNHIEKEGIIMRKEKMKRIGSWVLALAMAATLMGCAASGPEATDPGGTTGPVIEAIATDPGKATQPGGAATPAQDGKETEPSEHKETYEEVIARICRETNERNAAAKAEREAAAAEGSTETITPGTESTGNTGTSGNQGSGSTGNQGGSSTSGQGGGQPTTPPATIPTEPKPTDPPAIQPKPTEPPATEPQPTECQHVWQTVYHEEVGHKEPPTHKYGCTCGFLFNSVDEYFSHIENYTPEEVLNYHPSYGGLHSTWVVDTPAWEEQVCALCGISK